MRIRFLILLAFVVVAQGKAQLVDSSAAQAVKGAFYISVDDAATIYVNGNKFYAAGIGDSHSPEMTLKTGDRIVVHLRDDGGGRHFVMLFASPDGKNVVSFRSPNFKIVPSLDATDFTLDQYETWRRYTKAESFKNPLPITSNSESLWGDLSKCIIACVVKPAMVSQLAVSSGPAVSQTPAGTPGFFGSSATNTNPAAVSERTAVAVQSPLEKEFAQLQEQHEKALLAGAEAVNRRHLAALESLLSRARQSGDTQATNRISAELQRLRFAIQVTSEPANLTADGLTAFLVGTKWAWFGEETLTFLADGKVMWSHDQTTWPWNVANAKNLVIAARNTKLERNFTITFDRNLQTGTIEGDNATRKTQLIK